MKQLRNTFAAALILALANFNAFADAPNIVLGDPGYGGTGCPAGSASVTLSPDRTSLSILFDQYVTQAGGINGASFDRKTCNIAIPVRVPQGYSISVFKVDYRGYVNIPRGGEARFNVEYFFAGRRGPNQMKIFSGPFDQDYLLSSDIVAEAVIWSGCGETVNLRVNSSMLVKSNPIFEDALATVDTIDVKAGIIYHIQWKTCF
ncbi:MAG: DUF4360 domain-containing protein [Oligoflexia bacterium]|nr:DUF4360 domain-containing protein [Oligoflexia bacterium]MBF0367007.1 DUF4360 domain-containing protein [Oligoflexia bacterium]